MKEINIPFKEQFQKAILEGQKICTTRTKIYGKIGDRFRVFNAEFEIIAVCPSIALWVGNYLYKEEGFENPGNFHILWGKIHPRLRPDTVVFVHFFKRIDNT